MLSISVKLCKWSPYRCVFAKLCMGFFAMPLTFNDFLILGFAWGSWGEFSFILALRAVRGNLLSGSLEEVKEASPG